MKHLVAIPGAFKRVLLLQRFLYTDKLIALKILKLMQECLSVCLTVLSSYLPPLLLQCLSDYLIYPSLINPPVISWFAWTVSDCVRFSWTRFLFVFFLSQEKEGGGGKEGDEESEEGGEAGENPATTGSLGAQFGGASELFYNQFDLNTQPQKRNQIVLVQVLFKTPVFR